MTYTYTTRGTCSRRIDIEIDGGVIGEVTFYGGCNGNTKGIAALVKGMTPEQVIARFDGIQCGMRSTSCPDQLAQALKEIQAQQA